MNTRVLLLLATANIFAAAFHTCTWGGSDSHRNDCQMGWSTQHPEGPATGGEGAAPEHVFTVTTRAELVEALSYKEKKVPSRIIYIQGAIRGDDLGNGKYADDEYYRTYPTPNSFDPTKYLESCEQGSCDSTGLKDFQKNMEEQIRVVVPSHTSIIGVGANASVLGMWFHLKKKTENVVIRNLYFEVVQDRTSKWSSGDGWNAEFDCITLEGASRVWLDHLTVTDGRFSDSLAPVFKGKPVLYHDGMIDIKSQSDYVTVSHCVLDDHDKVMLIGKSDHETADLGHLRVTLYANVWSRLVQRQPRVRFGHVHVLSNAYHAISETTYFIGMGMNSSILSECNMFETLNATSDKLVFVEGFHGQMFADTGSWINGSEGSDRVNADAKEAGATGEPLSWEPPYDYEHPKDFAATAKEVMANAGSGLLSL